MLSDRRRIVRRPPSDTEGLPAELHPVLARVLRARRIRSPDELEHALKGLHPYTALAGIDAAVELLMRAIDERWHILVIGDFDADGATSTALAVRALKAFGAAAVDFLVPNRFEFGYGLTPEIVAVAARRGPDLIVTVDNGISSVDGVAAARAAGMRVLVTDHHLPGERLPQADAIVNPNRVDCDFPSKCLAGVGVVFYLLMALRAHLREGGRFADGSGPNLAQWLDLVALGTVADVVPLDRNNRILVAQGLARIRAGRACPGVRALLEAGRRGPERVVAADLGFAVAPRLNAAGRMDDMSLGIRCLLADDDAEARGLAAELEQLNLERRSVEAEMREQAVATLKDMHLPEEGGLPFGLCLYDPDWHEGVIGIVASRIRELVQRPVIVFTDGGAGNIKGSARSVPGLHIRDALDAVAARHPGLLVRFGGHAMAAGLTLAAGAYERFSEAFDAEVRRHLGEEDLEGTLLSDGELTPEEAGLELAELLRMAVPWGQGFPEPVFDGMFEVAGSRVVGERHLKLNLRWENDGRNVDAIHFNAPRLDVVAGMQVRLAYRLDVNEFRGVRSVQLVVEYCEQVQ